MEEAHSEEWRHGEKGCRFLVYMEEDQCRVAGPIANRIEGNTLGFESSLFRHENDRGFNRNRRMPERGPEEPCYAVCIMEG